MRDIHPSVKIHPTAEIYCKHIEIGEGGEIGRFCKIVGTSVKIGRNFWMDEFALIGGGSCFDDSAYLSAGDFLHMGKNSMINTARGVDIGDEVGLGINTSVFTHGAYLNELNGFPVQFGSVKIGSNVWLPNAIVNPGVSIGDNVVVASASLVNKNLPSGCLAGGTPAKIIKEAAYPSPIPVEKKDQLIKSILKEIGTDGETLSVEAGIISSEDWFVDCTLQTVSGSKDDLLIKVLNQLRRHGIRFRYSFSNSKPERWV